MKIVVSIFLLPYEIDDLDRIVSQFRLGAALLSGRHQWVLDVALCIADDMINWRKSSLPRTYFEDRLSSIEKRSDWCQSSFSCTEEIKGCVSQRRATLHKYPDADYFIWLDCDIIFSERTLTFFEQAAERLLQPDPFVILTPEIVRIWDSTWDCLVNEKFMQQPVGYQQYNDPFRDAGVKGPVSLEKVVNTVAGQPRYKFAGGWFTCLSSKLLRRTGVPASFGHYGLEDTFIMLAAEKLMAGGVIDIQQYKLKNLVVCENYAFRDYKYLTEHLMLNDRKEEFRKIAAANLNSELSNVT